MKNRKEFPRLTEYVHGIPIEEWGMLEPAPWCQRLDALIKAMPHGGNINGEWQPTFMRDGFRGLTNFITITGEAGDHVADLDFYVTFPDGEPAERFVIKYDPTVWARRLVESYGIDEYLNDEIFHCLMKVERWLEQEQPVIVEGDYVYSRIIHLTIEGRPIFKITFNPTYDMSEDRPLASVDIRINAEDPNDPGSPEHLRIFKYTELHDMFFINERRDVWLDNRERCISLVNHILPPKK